MLTVIESPLFSKLWPDYWSVEEHGELTAFLAGSPEAGSLIHGSSGCRKIRWTRPGMGKRGGVRVIYTVRLKSGAVVFAHHLFQEREGQHSLACTAQDRGGT